MHKESSASFSSDTKVPIYIAVIRSIASAAKISKFKSPNLTTLGWFFVSFIYFLSSSNVIGPRLEGGNKLLLSTANLVDFPIPEPILTNKNSIWIYETLFPAT